MRRSTLLRIFPDDFAAENPVSRGGNRPWVIYGRPCAVFVQEPMRRIVVFVPITSNDLVAVDALSRCARHGRRAGVIQRGPSARGVKEGRFVMAKVIPSDNITAGNAFSTRVSRSGKVQGRPYATG